MPSKLKYFINDKGEKVYTLKTEVNNIPTKEAHYKFIKLKDAPKNN